jgi:hypothetical protein
VNFVSPPWLVAAGMVALPFLLHLIRTERFQRCELATVRFLVAAVRERGGRKQIANWPLLLARAGVLIALALLLARPFRKEARAAAESGGETLVLCDVSGSQARQGAPGPAKTVEQCLADLPKGAHVTLARFADEVQAVEDRSTLGPLAGAGTDVSRAIGWAIDRRAQAGGKAGRVILVSDFPREAMRHLSPRLWPAGTEVEVRSTGKTGVWNLGIERVELLTPVATGAVEVEVSVRGSGAMPKAPVRVRFTPSGGEALEQTLAPGQSRAKFRMETAIPDEGLLMRGTVLIEPASGDAIEADNARPFAFVVARQRKVLLIDGDPGETVFGDETYYLGKALSTTWRADEVPIYRVETRRKVGDPRGFDVVALCNTGALGREEGASLRAMLDAGGSLLITTGTHTTPALFDALAAAGVAFGRVEMLSAPTAGTSVLTAVEHPALRGLDRVAVQDWRQIELTQQWRLQPAAGVKVLATYEKGAPLLVEAARAGASGRAMAFLHSVDRQESEFPREPLFVPWARELFRYLARADEPRWHVQEKAVSLTDSRPAGVYVEGNEVTVIAPDPGEIEVVPATLEEARQAIGGNRTAVEESVPSERSVVLVADVPGHLRPLELWPIVAVTLFLLLVTEALLAARSAAPRP